MSRRTTDYDRPHPRASLTTIVAVGLTAGLIGVATYLGFCSDAERADSQYDGVRKGGAVYHQEAEF